MGEKRFFKKLDQNLIILKPEMIFQNGSAFKWVFLGYFEDFQTQSHDIRKIWYLLYEI